MKCEEFNPSLLLFLIVMLVLLYIRRDVQSKSKSLQAKSNPVDRLDVWG